MNWKLTLLVVVICVGGSLSFQQDYANREAMIAADAKKRVLDFKKSLLKRCRKKVMDEAGIRVDSILIARSKDMPTIDSLVKPPKPIKPYKPIVPPLKDTRPVTPMLEGEVEKVDTLAY